MKKLDLILALLVLASIFSYTKLVEKQNSMLKQMNLYEGAPVPGGRNGTIEIELDNPEAAAISCNVTAKVFQNWLTVFEKSVTVSVPAGGQAFNISIFIPDGESGVRADVDC